MIATKTCACGQEIEFEAEMARESCCPNCGAALMEALAPGAHLPLSPRKRKRTLEIVLGSLMLLSALWLAGQPLMEGLLAGIEKADRAREKERIERTLYALGTNAVTVRLKAPRTAVFDGMGAMEFGKGSDGCRTMYGYVDSQNGFGALVRTRFKVEFTSSGDAVYDVYFPDQE